MPSVVEIIKVQKVGSRRGGGQGWWWWLLIFLLLIVPIGFLIFSSASFCKAKKRAPSLLGNSLSVESHMSGGGVAANSAGGGVRDIESPGEAVPSGPETHVVMYHATWCGHCKEMRPVFNQVAAQVSKNIKFSACENEVLQKSGQSDKLQIKGYPTVIAFRNGSKVSEAVGNMPADKLLNFINQLQ
jgi:thiol-disulfide isomerase/thioredoxin